MIDISKGRYWDKPLSLVSSCSRCSPGCQNCWSLAMEKRFHKGIEGQIEVHPDRLSIPLKRRKPTVYAVWNDLFHEAVPDEFIDDTIECISAEYDHTFLILTKRPQNLIAWVNRTKARLYLGHALDRIYWGLTVCNQAEADEKIPIFLQVPGKKFLSIEPMLGKIDIVRVFYNWGKDGYGCSNIGITFFKDNTDAVILGGETGPGARPLHPDWVRSVRDQCAASNVPFFFKQWGEWLPEDMATDHQLTKQPRHERFYPSCMKPKKVMGSVVTARVGRKEAGRLLDGRTHDELPWRTP